MNTQQFTYTINTADKYDEDANMHQFSIDVGGINTPYNLFQVQCIGFTCNVDAMVGEPFYVSLSVRDFAEQFYCSSLPSNECVLGTITTSQNGGGVLNNSEGCIFNVANVRQKRKLVFTLRGLDLEPLTTTVAPHADVYIQCDLIFTPIS